MRRDLHPAAGLLRVVQAEHLAAMVACFDQLAEIVSETRPGSIVVAVADRRRRLPLQALVNSRVSGIRVEDARWLYRHLGRVTDQQLRDALIASGASREDADSFAASLRERIAQIGRAGSDQKQP